jgi:hypothetical protein
MHKEKQTFPIKYIVKDMTSKILLTESVIIAYLEIIKGSSRDVIIKFPHHVPRPISNPHQNY